MPSPAIIVADEDTLEIFIITYENWQQRRYCKAMYLYTIKYLFSHHAISTSYTARSKSTVEKQQLNSVPGKDNNYYTYYCFLYTFLPRIAYSS